jgi:hypothetical protein
VRQLHDVVAYTPQPARSALAGSPLV